MRRLLLASLLALLLLALAVQPVGAGPAAPAAHGRHAAEGSPSAPRAGGPEPWPREGSFLRYEVRAGGGSPGGDYREWSEAEVTLRHEEGAWVATCVGARHVYATHEDPAGGTTVTPYRLEAPLAPPVAPTDVKAGEPVAFPTLGPDCQPSGESSVVVGRTRHATLRDGAPVEMRAWSLSTDHGCGCMSTTAAWSVREGIVLAWDFAGRASHASGRLVDTDAPLR